jgi:hypothetical protein
MTDARTDQQEAAAELEIMQARRQALQAATTLRDDVETILELLHRGETPCARVRATAGTYALLLDRTALLDGLGRSLSLLTAGPMEADALETVRER